MLTKNEVKKIQNRTSATEDEELINAFGILSDKKRFKIVKILLTHDELCVTDLANIVNSSVSAVSHQLRLLEMSGLVKKNRKGQTICYNIKKENKTIKKIIRIIN